MKYEIEIEGVPEEWEPVGYRMVDVGEHYLDGSESGIFVNTCTPEIMPLRPAVVVSKKTRKYDWSKVHGDVLVENKKINCLQPRSWFPNKSEAIAGFYKVWQVNPGVCPVDPEGTVVEVELVCGTKMQGLANEFTWLKGVNRNESRFGYVVAQWRFIRLDDGVEF